MSFEHLITIIVHYVILLLEAMGVFIIAITAIKSFVKYAIRKFNFTDDTVKIELAKALAIGLEFKLGAEILKTVTIRTFEEVSILAAVLALRIVLSFVIHWEIKSIYH